MNRLSGIDRLTAYGPPNGDYARYVQQLSNAVGSTRQPPLPSLPALRPVAAPALKPVAPVAQHPVHAHPAPAYSPAPATVDDADQDYDDDEADEDEDDAEPLTDAQIAELRRALAQESSNSGAAGLKIFGRLLTALGIGLMLYVVFGNGGALSIFFAFVSFYIGGKLRKAAD